MSGEPPHGHRTPIQVLVCHRYSSRTPRRRTGTAATPPAPTPPSTYTQQSLYTHAVATLFPPPPSLPDQVDASRCLSRPGLSLARSHMHEV